MEQTAKVYRVTDERISVVYSRDLSDKQKSSRRFWRVRERSFFVANPKTLNVHEGDFVELHIPPGKTIVAAFMVFIFPLLCFAAFYALAGALFSGWGELLKAAAGGAGFILGFALNAVVHEIRQRTNRESLPEITRLISEEKANHPDETGKKDCAACGICN